MNRERFWQALQALVTALAVLVGLQVVPPPTTPPDVTPPVEPEPRPPRPAPPKPEPKEPDPDPWNAIVRIGSGNVGCSATVIGPKRPDGRYWVLSAAHCVERTGQRWTMKFRDGRTGGLTVVNFNRTSDFAWMVTDADSVVYPYALLAEKTPPNGAGIYHGGFGTDVPGNKENGTLVAQPNSEGQVQMRLSVSSGDSGGGIAWDMNGQVISCVCCTTGRGQFADVWGASVESIRRGQTTNMNLEEWIPTPIPLKMPPKE